jgi:uncharacterized phage-like protein YoqJ
MTGDEQIKAEPQPIGPYIAVTGHRPPGVGGYKIPNPIYDAVVYGLAEAFMKFKPSYVFTGMSLGVDQWAAEVCMNMDIPFIAVVPFEGQDSIWPPHSKAKYSWLLSKAAQTIMVSQGGFEPSKMQKRNKWMIDRCHQVVAVYNGSAGGTANCLSYAAEIKRPIYYVPLQPKGMVVGSNPNAGYPEAQSDTKTAVENKTAKRVIDL